MAIDVLCNQLLLEMSFWMGSQNRHATCSELKKGRFYQNKTQQCMRFNEQSSNYNIVILKWRGSWLSNWKHEQRKKSWDLRKKFLRGEPTGTLLMFRIFEPNANKYFRTSLPYKMKKNRKETATIYYYQLSMVALLHSHSRYILGRIGRECTIFYTRLAKLIARHCPFRSS